ncbi:MAG: ATP-binding protein, partial [Fimbriimonadales bacterium]|nr:ATP-binding protein [Fimbriimonadales bacterium]
SRIPQMLLDFETGTILAFNNAARQFYGDAILSQQHINCVCAENLDWNADLKPFVASQRYGMRVSKQYVGEDEVRFVEAHYALVSLRGRPVVHLMCFDVTERVQAQQELELSRNRYQAFIQLSSEAIWRNMMTEPIPVILPVERQIELIFERSYLAECNLAYCRAWGAASPDELVGTFTRERIPPDDPRNREAVRQFILQGYRLSNWLHEGTLPNGRECFRLYSFQGIVHEGLLWGVWGVFRDVTELIQTQRALQASEERYRTFVNLASEGIWRFEATEPIPTNLPVEEQVRLILERGYLAECNPAFARMYGVSSPEALLGAPLARLLIPEDPQNLEMLRAFVENGYRVDGLASRERAIEDGDRYYLNSFLGVVENGLLVRAWGVQTDITELRRLQQQLEQAHRLESIGRLAGGIAHDFNNVLTAVIGFAELARARVQDETTLRYLDGIIQAAERAANLNRQLLTYARKQVVQLSPMDLGVWLAGTLEMLRRVLPESIRLQTEVEPNLWQVQGDPNLLLQILLNLVVNARDAMPNGGTITIYLQNKTLRRRRTHGVPNGNYVQLSVADTGVGIPPEVLPHIFEPFYTTKPLGQGSGMGLAAVQGAVQQLGGHIEVQTQLGKGTRFHIYFPRLTPARDAR